MRITTLITALFLSCAVCGAQNSHKALKPGLYMEGGKNHVQGIAVDEARGYMYMSFTTVFYKTDLQGNVLASMAGIPGHLGAMTLNPEDGKVYASLEFKDDEIGQGIAKNVEKQVQKSVFYVAIIDVDKMDRIGMDAEKDGVLKTVCIKDACRDYADKVTNKGKEVEHRYGCSGIDGITFAPAFGKGGRGKLYLYVAYGIYSDVDRTDNDYQVLLCYDIKLWDKLYAKTLTYKDAHQSGPELPLYKYFIRTMNTNYGVQNMGYDPYTKNIFMMVYKGKKEGCPNYAAYAVDVLSKPFKAPLIGNDDTLHKEGAVLQMPLSMAGLYDQTTNTWGWNFKWGSTGFCPLGDGYYLFSENGKTPEKVQFTNINLYKWTGNPESPFELVK